MAIVKINNFSGGIAKDTREPSTNKCAYTQNFDILNFPYKLKPFPGMADDSALTYNLQGFVYGDFGSGVGSNFLALGTVSDASALVEVYKKTGTSDITTAWTTALSSTGTGSVPVSYSSNLWHLYQGYLYFASTSTYIGRVGNVVSSGSSATISSTWTNLSPVDTSSATQAITHPKDDVMYFGVGNIVYKNDSGTLSVGITLPTYVNISAVTYYGNYLAIACRSDLSIDGSVVYIWDRDSTLETLTESVDWGTGSLFALENINGELVGVSLEGDSAFNISSRLKVKVWNGGSPIVAAEVYGSALVGTPRNKYYRSGDKLYFPLFMTINGASRSGVAVVGKNEQSEWIIAGDVNVNNDTAITSIDAMVKFGDAWLIAYNSGGAISRSLVNSSFTGTSFYETLINPSMPVDDRHRPKILRAVSVSYEKLSSTGAVVLKYRVDGATSWTTIQTDSTDDSVYMEATAESDGTPFADFREIEFRVESTGGAVITEVGYRYDVKTSQING